MYLIKFVRNDGQANELYYYSKRADALYHISLFHNDNSNLYKKIEIIKV